MSKIDAVKCVKFLLSRRANKENLKMKFQCFRCKKDFSLEKEVISHLKKVHFMIDNVSPIKCVVKNCEKSYNTFKGLSSHLKIFNHLDIDEVNTIYYSSEISKMFDRLMYLFIYFQGFR